MQSSPEYWEQRATELSRTSLETIRASATAWAATTTALLGVFGTVAIVKGPDSISALQGTSRDVVTGLVVGAAVVAFTSVLATGYASRGPTKRYAPLTGLRLADVDEADRAECAQRTARRASHGNRGRAPGPRGWHHRYRFRIGRKSGPVERIVPRPNQRWRASMRCAEAVRQQPRPGGQFGRYAP